LRLRNFLGLFPYGGLLAARLFPGDFATGWRQYSFRWNLRRRTFRPRLLGSLRNLPRLLARGNTWLVTTRWRQRPFRCGLRRTFGTNLFAPVRNAWGRRALRSNLFRPLRRWGSLFRLLRRNAWLLASGWRQRSLRGGLSRALRLNLFAPLLLLPLLLFTPLLFGLLLIALLLLLLLWIGPLLISACR